MKPRRERGERHEVLSSRSVRGSTLGSGDTDGDARGRRGAAGGCRRRRLSQRSAYLGRRIRSRPWQTVVAEGPRDSAAFDDGPRNRWPGPGDRTRCQRRDHWQNLSGLSLDRLRPMRGMPPRRREPVRHAQLLRDTSQWRIRGSNPGAASKISRRHRRFGSVENGAVRLLGPYRVQRAPEGRRGSEGHGARDLRRRRARAHLHRDIESDRRQGRRRARRRPFEARGREKERLRPQSIRARPMRCRN